ncbi:MAG: hypothetical protein GY720_11420 [bacterium]|nr:hypothetical protein [bacterium]
MRRRFRVALMAIHLALAPSEHESMWSHLDGRPVAVLPIGRPVTPLVARFRR